MIMTKAADMDNNRLKTEQSLIEQYNLMDDLKSYLAFEIEKLKLFELMKQARKKQIPEQKWSAQFFQHDRQLKLFAKKMMSKLETTPLIQNMKKRRFPSAAVCNNFIKIQQRLENGMINNKEVADLIYYIHRTANKNQK